MSVVSAPSTPTHHLPHATFTSLATPKRGSRETSVWRVELAANAPGVPHEVTREEVFVVLRGAARVLLAGTETVAHAGDAIVVPPNTPFAISSASDASVEALCCLPVGGQARTLDGQVFTPPWAE